MSTELLLPRIASGDPTAVPECVARYGGLVWSLARRFLGNPVDAEDAVQDVFVDLWKNAYRFNPLLSAEPTFVTMVARRRLIDRKHRADRTPVASRLASDLADQAQAGEYLTDVRDEANRAAMALGELREDEQQVIRMAIYDAMTHAEIAAHTGLPLGTVKTHIRRGLLRIREMLAGGEA